MIKKKSVLVWSVVQLRPNMFNKVKLNLERQSFKCFGPTKMVTIRVNNV